MIEFSVLVHRYWADSMSELWDGDFVSKVYAIKGNKFLVYDDEAGFIWVDYTETIPECGNVENRIRKVELFEG